ncbi:MAG: hypothetical protein AAF438_20260 [Pseudomonadota bacterium]
MNQVSVPSNLNRVVLRYLPVNLYSNIFPVIAESSSRAGISPWVNDMYAMKTLIPNDNSAIKILVPRPIN